MARPEVIDNPGPVIGGTNRDQRERTQQPLVFVKKLWSDAWTPRLDLNVATISRTTRSGGPSSARLTRAYGKGVREPYQTAHSLRIRENLDDWWVWIRFVDIAPQNVADFATGEVPPAPGTGQFQNVFVGRIDQDASDIDHVYVQSGATLGGTGVQTFVATSPENWLERIQVYEGWWRKLDYSGSFSIDDQLSVRKLGWLPPLNWRGALGRLRGNMTDIALPFSPAGADKARVFGGREPWTHAEFVNYLLRAFVQKRLADGTEDPNAPFWTFVGGSYLDVLAEPIEFGESASVAEMLDIAIRRVRGLDWFVQPLISNAADENADVRGFAIEVRSVQSAAANVGGTPDPNNPGQFLGGITYPANASIFPYAVGGTITRPKPGDRALITRDGSELYDGVRLVGQRIVVCLSFSTASNNLWTDGWSSADETAYRTGVAPVLDANAAAINDAYRRQPRFERVFQAFVANLQRFDFQAGLANPQPSVGGVTLPTAIEFQRLVRGTLPWLPLLQGYDYTTQTPTPTGVRAVDEGQRLAPMAWVRASTIAPGNQYVPVDEQPFAASVRALEEEIGVTVRWGNINHAAAGNRWTNPGASDFSAAFDFNTLVFTIAIETDFRLALEWMLPPSQRKDRGVKVIEMRDAGFWWLAPQTVVGANPLTGELQRSPVSGTILRDDRARLQAALAGAVARYTRRRLRCEITQRGLQPIVGVLGSMLRPGELLPGEFGEGMVTSIDWVTDGQGGSTRFKTESWVDE